MSSFNIGDSVVTEPDDNAIVYTVASIAEDMVYIQFENKNGIQETGGCVAECYLNFANDVQLANYSTKLNNIGE